MELFEIIFDTEEQKECVAPSFPTLEECKSYIHDELSEKYNGYFSDYKEIRVINDGKIVYKIKK